MVVLTHLPIHLDLVVLEVALTVVMLVIMEPTDYHPLAVVQVVVGLPPTEVKVELESLQFDIKSHKSLKLQKQLVVVLVSMVARQFMSSLQLAASLLIVHLMRPVSV